MEYVDTIASGYEWTCPECETLNTEIEWTEDVYCDECAEHYKARFPEHALG